MKKLSVLLAVLFVMVVNFAVSANDDYVRGTSNEEYSVGSAVYAEDAGARYAVASTPYFAYNDGSGSGWQFNKTMDKGSDGSYSYTFTTTDVGYFAVQTKDGASDWDSASFYSPVSDGDYWIKSFPAEVAVSASNAKNCFRVPEKGVYIVKFDGDNVYVSKELPIYFYGDMNMWSAIKNADTEQTIKDLSNNDVTATIYGANPPKYLTEEELDSEWRLHLMDGAPEGQTTGSGDWYMLDFTDKVDRDGHKGRLCGQFKLLDSDGDYELAAWGSEYKDSEYDDQYYSKDKSIRVNTPFVATKATNLRNLHMYNAYVEGAILYFQPNTNTILITGEAKDLYVYYVAPENSTYEPGVSSKNMADKSSQVNYLVNAAEFNSAQWESVMYVTAPNGITYEKAYKVRIPYGAEHRYPIEFNVKMAKSTGSYFPVTRVQCEDIWFIERTVDVYFRYEDDTITPSEVGYNAFIENIDPDLGYVTGYEYLAGGEGKYIKMDKEQYAAAADVERDASLGGHEWFKSPEPLNEAYISGAWALFKTSQGATYPDGGEKATGSERASVAIQGSNLYYVVPKASDLEILYSHLKGTYQKDADHYNYGLQVNAELKDAEGDLVTTNDVQYSFSFKGTDYTKTQELSDKPYMDIPAGSLPAGFYQVTVKAVKDGETYIANDIYPVYPAAATGTTQNVIRRAENASTPIKIYTYNGSGDWSGAIEMSVDGNIYYYNTEFTVSDLFILRRTENTGTPDWNAETGYIADKTASNDDYWLENEETHSDYDCRRCYRVSYESTDDSKYAVIFDADKMTLCLKSGTYVPQTTTDIVYLTTAVDEVTGEPESEFYMSNFSQANNVITVNHKGANYTGANRSWAKFSDKTLNADESDLATNKKASHTCVNYANAYYRSYAESDDARIARTTLVEPVGTTGVEEIAVDVEEAAVDAPVEYYNLQGVRVAEPKAGLYIRVQGKTVTKVYIR